MGKGGKRRKGAGRKGSLFIGAWVPASVVAAVDEVIQTSNLNRSHFLRQALAEKIRKEGGGRA